jgi:Na+-transporting NADH:ubiquinone oxidoreductase subunit C
MKKGQKPLDGADYVDAISGGTITSKGVQSMIQDCLLPYEPFLKSLDK